MGDPLSTLQAARSDLVVVKVDIDRVGKTRIDWGSPVAQQFSLRRVPHFVVYSPDGEIVAADGGRSSSEAAGRDLVHGMLVALPGHSAGNES